MKANGRNTYTRMVIGAVVLLAGVRAGLAAPDAKPADPFLKGNQPATMPAKITSAKEPAVSPPAGQTLPPGTVLPPAGITKEQAVETKMRSIVIPDINFQGVALDKAITFLEGASREYDDPSLPPDKRGVNIIVRKVAAPVSTDPFASAAADGNSNIRFNARFVTLWDALKLVTEMGGYKFRIHGNVVILTPAYVPNEMNVTPRQIEIEAQFVTFDLANVEKLLASGGLTMDALANLWIGGGGHLLAAPRVVTVTGQEAVIKEVTEVVYPTSFTAEGADDNTTGDNTNTNMANHATNTIATVHDHAVCGPVVIPSGFQTREVGTILQVVPEVSAEDDMINLTLNPQLVGEPVWHDYGSRYLDSNGKELQARMEQPWFPVSSVSTRVSVLNGQRVLIGGGAPARDHKQLVYIFVTARLLEINGERIK